MLSEIRTGKFTSSQIYKLMLKGRGNSVSLRTMDYIEEVKIEKRLGRTLNSTLSTRPTIWGKALEPRVASMLGEFTYQYVSDETIVHPDVPVWAGTPDLIAKDRVADIKCPYTLKSFAQLVDSMDKGAASLRETHPEYFWQLVSNAILTGKEKAELIVYCPYRSELQEIRDSVENLDDTDLQTEAQWINFNRDEMLPWIPENGYYKNLNRMSFAIMDDEKRELSEKVTWATQQLQ